MKDPQIIFALATLILIIGLLGSMITFLQLQNPAEVTEKTQYIILEIDQEDAKQESSAELLPITNELKTSHILSKATPPAVPEPKPMHKPFPPLLMRIKYPNMLPHHKYS